MNTSILYSLYCEYVHRHNRLIPLVGRTERPFSSMKYIIYDNYIPLKSQALLGYNQTNLFRQICLVVSGYATYFVVAQTRFHHIPGMFPCYESSRTVLGPFRSPRTFVARGSERGWSMAIHGSAGHVSPCSILSLGKQAPQALASRKGRSKMKTVRDDS